MAKSNKKKYGPETKCYKCGANMTHWKLRHGVKWTIRLTKVKVKGRVRWVCQWCK